MSLTRKVAFNTIIQILGKAATTVISLFLVAALTRYLGVEGFGQYTTIFAYMGVFSVLADFGFFWILVREIAKPDADVNKSLSNILTLRTLLGIVFYGTGFLLSFFIPNYEGFRSGIGIIAFASLWLTMNSTYVGVFQNKLRMEIAAITDVLGRAIILLITLYLIKQDMGLGAILWAYAFGNIVNFFASAWLGRGFAKLKLGFDFKYWKEVFSQALPMGIALMLNFIYFKIDTVMLSLLKSPTDVGIYGPPYKVLEILLLIPAMFMGNVFPIITRYVYEKDDRLKSVLQKSFDFLMILALPIVLGAVFTAPRIVKIVAGREFVGAHTIEPLWGLPSTSPTALQILVIAVGISFISHLFGYLVIAVGKQSKLILPYLILAVFNVALNLVLIPKISYIGAAITTVLTEFLVLIFSWYLANKFLELKLNLGIVWKTVFGGLILGLFLYFWAEYIHLLILIPVAGVIYFAALWLVKGISKDMIKALLAKS